LPPVSPPFAKPKFEEISLSDTPTAAIAVAPETLTVTWMVAGSIVVELLILIVFLVRAAWWLSGRFTSIDGNFAATTKEITQLNSANASTVSKATRIGARALENRSPHPKSSSAALFH
jgi:hypothetical protein